VTPVTQEVGKRSLVDSAEESLVTGRGTLAAAVTDTQSEQSKAASWGN
jgi:hypothetical protein